MINPNDFIQVHTNIFIEVRERGKLVTSRQGHNVFTDTGRDWLSKLAAWQTIGSPDVPYTQRRVRWMGLGTGTQAETAGVTQLQNPAQVTQDIYLGAIQSSNILSFNSVEFVREFSTSEISIPILGLNVVPITEAGIFVDVQPASTSDGVDDSPAGGVSDTTLDTSSQVNSPVAYKVFDPINKTVDFSLVIRWTFTI